MDTRPLAHTHREPIYFQVPEPELANGCSRGLHAVLRFHTSSAVAELIEDFEAVDLVLKAGDVSVHNPRIVHGSNANTSDRRRGGLTIRYM